MPEPGGPNAGRPVEPGGDGAGAAAADRATGAVVARVAALARELSGPGGEPSIGRLLTALRALAAVDAGSRAESYGALRAALCTSPEDVARFPAAFARVFGGASTADPGAEAAAPVPPPSPSPAPRPPAARRPSAPEGPPSAAAPLPPQAALAPPAAERDGDDRERATVPATHSALELLRHKDFADYDEAELAQARRLLPRLVRDAPLRQARRRARDLARRGAPFDLAATVRDAVATGGEPLRLRHRGVRWRPRRVVFVCDVSGSMAPYARMLVQYVHAWVAAGLPAEVFVFSTRLTRVTRELRATTPDAALRRAAEQAQDWAGGTRIGAAVATLNREHAGVVGRSAIVVVLSDGWERGDPEQLGSELARLRRCAHRLLWLNPLAGDPRYEPLTRGMVAALPSTDRLLPAHSLAALEELSALLADGLGKPRWPGLGA